MADEGLKISPRVGTAEQTLAQGEKATTSNPILGLGIDKRSLELGRLFNQTTAIVNRNFSSLSGLLIGRKNTNVGQPRELPPMDNGGSGDAPMGEGGGGGEAAPMGSGEFMENFVKEIGTLSNVTLNDNLILRFTRDPDAIIYSKLYSPGEAYTSVYDMNINTFEKESFFSEQSAIQMQNVDAIAKSFQNKIKEELKNKDGKYLFYDSGVINNGKLAARPKTDSSFLMTIEGHHLSKLRQKLKDPNDRSLMLSQYLDQSIDLKDDSYPGIGAILTFRCDMNLSESNTYEAQYFSEHATTAVMSKAVPFLNVQVVNQLDADYMKKDGNLEMNRAFGMSMEDFLSGNTIDEKTIPIGITDLSESGKTENIKGRAITSGMEIFTTPQTFANPDRDIESNIISDLMRPYLSITGFEVRVTGLGFGTAAYKLANLKMRLHDRSKLKKIGKLLSPDYYDSVRFKITYGYSVAGANLTGRLPEDFVNRMKLQENYQVANSSYTLNDSEVDIDLTLASVGTAAVDETDITPKGLSVSYKQCLGILKKARETLLGIKSKGFTDIKIPTVIEGEGYQDFFSFNESTLKEIREFNAKLQTKGGSDAKDAAKKLISLFGSPKRYKNSKVSAAKKSRAKDIKSIINKKSTPKTPDPFLHKCYFGPSSKLETRMNDSTYISLGHLIMKFVGPALHRQSGGTEVLFNFGCCNQHAGASFVENLASVPLEKSKVIKALCDDDDAVFKSQSKVTISKFIAEITRKLLSDQNTVAYFGIDRKKLKTTNDKENALRKIYNNGVGSTNQTVVFKPISLGVKIDSGPLSETSPGSTFVKIDEKKKVIRISIFDMAHNSKVTMQDLLSAVDDTGKIELPVRKERGRVYGPKHMNLVLSQIKDMDFAIDKKEGLDGDGNKIPGKVTLKRVPGIHNSIKEHIKSYAGSLVYGTDSSCIIKADLSLEADSTILSQRLVETKAPDDGDGAQANDLPMLVMPGSLSLQCFGCHYFHVGQQLFIDFGTDTTLDGFYSVISISHSIAEGKFITSLEMLPTGTMPIYRSMASLATNIDTENK